MLRTLSICLLLHGTSALTYTVKGTSTYAYSPLAAFGHVPSPKGELYTLGQAAPYDMCTPIAESLRPLVRGKALLVQRGGCSFVRKACMAQQAGAGGVVVYNSFQTDASSNGQPTQPTNDMQITPINYPVHMFGISNDVTIPMVMVSSRDGIILNQLVMHSGSHLKINITTEAPPGGCGAWDRWSEDPLQCNSRAQQLISYHLPLKEWLQSRSEAAYYVVGDVQIARIAFTIGAVLSFGYLVLAGSRKTRMDSQAQKMQKEQQRRVFNIFVTFCAFFFAAFSYGVDMWGGDCESDHVATIFMLQRLASTCCIISYLLEAYYIHSNDEGHTNPYMNTVAKLLPNACGYAFVKLECFGLIFIDFLIVFFYITQNRSYVLFMTLSTIRILFHLVLVLIAHFGAVRTIYTSIMIHHHLGSDSSFPIQIPHSLKKRFQFAMLAKLSAVSLIVQGIFATVQIVQQCTILLLPTSLDYPAIWLDSYFTFLALPQLLQLWCSLGIGSGLYFLFAHCALVNETSRDIKLGLAESHALFTLDGGSGVGTAGGLNSSKEDVEA